MYKYEDVIANMKNYNIISSSQQLSLWARGRHLKDLAEKSKLSQHQIRRALKKFRLVGITRPQPSQTDTTVMTRNIIANQLLFKNYCCNFGDKNLLAAELGISKKYLNILIKQYNYGRFFKSNKKREHFRSHLSLHTKDILDNVEKISTMLTNMPIQTVADYLGVHSMTIRRHIQRYEINDIVISTRKVSRIEYAMMDILNSMNIHYERNNRSLLDGLELDFILPDYNIAIECNGYYWHSDQFKTVNYHTNKWKMCLNKNIGLLQFIEPVIINDPGIVIEKIFENISTFVPTEKSYKLFNDFESSLILKNQGYRMKKINKHKYLIENNQIVTFFDNEKFNHTVWSSGISEWVKDNV